SSEAMSTLRRPCSTRRLASLAVVVVLPEPCRPTIMIGTGAGALRSTGSPRVPSVSISWSCTIFTTIWPGVTDLMTSTPTAWLFTLSTKARTTSSATSASSRARRTSRSAASTSASVSAPRRVKRSRMPPSLSESESNISCRCPAGLVLRDAPFGAPQDEGLPNTCGARGRIALSGVGLRPPGPVGGLHFGSWRERAEPMDAAPRSQERRALPGFLLSPRSRLLAGPSSITLDRRTRKRPVGNGRITHANHAGAVDRGWTGRPLCRSDMVAAVGCRLSQPSGQPNRAIRPRRRHRHSREVDRPKAFRPLRQVVRGREPPRRRHGDRRGPSREKPARWLHHHDGDERHHGDEYDALQETALRSGKGSHTGRH